jgi:hypothetical protein
VNCTVTSSTAVCLPRDRRSGNSTTAMPIATLRQRPSNPLVHHSLFRSALQIAAVRDNAVAAKAMCCRAESPGDCRQGRPTTLNSTGP